MKLGEVGLFYCFPVFYKTLRKSPVLLWASELIFFQARQCASPVSVGVGKGD